MRLNGGAWQVVFSDDDLRCAALRSREALELKSPRTARTQIDARHIFGLRPLQLRALFADDIGVTVRDALLRVQRRALVYVSGHALHRLHETVGVVFRAHDALKRMAADAIEEWLFLLGGARHAREPLGVRELRGAVAHFHEFQVQGWLCAKLHCGGSGEFISSGADRDFIFAGLEAPRGKAIATLCIRHHGDGNRGPRALCTHEDAFHRAFLGGSEAASQRRDG